MGKAGRKGGLRMSGGICAWMLEVEGEGMWSWLSRIHEREREEGGGRGKGGGGSINDGLPRCRSFNDSFCLNWF